MQSVSTQGGGNTRFSNQHFYLYPKSFRFFSWRYRYLPYTMGTRKLQHRFVIFSLHRIGLSYRGANMATMHTLPRGGNGNSATNFLASVQPTINHSDFASLTKTVPKPFICLTLFANACTNDNLEQ